MSFRKRGDILNGTGNHTRLATHRHIPTNDRGPIQAQIQPLNKTLSPGNIVGQKGSHESIMNSPYVRPSTVTSQPVVSTGSNDLDKLLTHSGIPLGSLLLIEENGSTDYASVLLRYFVAQSVIQSRENKKENSNHVIIIGSHRDFVNNLPGPYQGSSKDQKKALVQANESKISVSNLADSSASSLRNTNDLKIAWRYGLSKKTAHEQVAETNTSNNAYCTQFDITQRIIPSPDNHEVSFITLSNSYIDTCNDLEKTVQRLLKINRNMIIRLIIPSFLRPGDYRPAFSKYTYAIPFAHSLKSIIKKYSSNISAQMSVSLDLYPRLSHLTALLELLADGVINLQPFNEDMAKLIERAYKNEPWKIQQGLVHVFKIPALSERGMMLIRDGEFAFKNNRKRFEIESWGIPVEEEEDNKEKQSKEQTKVNIEF